MKKETKSLKKAVKRINKDKDEVTQEIIYKQKMAKIKKMVEEIYPEIESLSSIYDGQTVVNALSGFIVAHIEKKVLDIKMDDILIDLSQEEDSEIKTAITKIIKKMEGESAQVLSETLEKFGQSLSQYSAHTFMKQPMATIKLTDILS
jgi:hypothetical protein